MKKIIFICPFFGNMPFEHMNLWLKSCEYNQDIDWLVITDDRTQYRYPVNVKVEYISFQELKKFIQNKFDFEIQINNPYKLCDFKPAYGYIFEEYIKDYEFWGHCDMTDCIFGDLSEFFIDELLSNNDKLGFLGHMTIYRNTYDINRRFMLQTSSGITLSEILGVLEHMAFDEINKYSINTIYDENCFSFTRVDDMYIDISPMTYAFRESSFDDVYKQYYKKRIPMIFEWNNGKLYQCTINKHMVVKRELGYVHFQKRKMKKHFEGEKESFYIIPEGYITLENELSVKDIRRFSKNKLIYFNYFVLKYKALKYRLEQIKKKLKYKKY